MPFTTSTDGMRQTSKIVSSEGTSRNIALHRCIGRRKRPVTFFASASAAARWALAYAHTTPRSKHGKHHGGAWGPGSRTSGIATEVVDRQIGLLTV
eukprot:scaffold50247_cov25-Prasinocladus_malaysianus.AAC.1